MDEQGPKQRAANKGVFEVLTYVWEYQTYADTLRADSQNLKARLCNMQREVEDARSNRQDIKQQVVKWLEEGNKELKLTESFLESLQPPATCWKFTSECDCKHRYAVAKRAKSRSKRIKTLMESYSFEGGVSLERKPLPLTPTMASNYIAIPSREKYLERIMEALLGGDKLLIGIYGAKDVGKSMFIKKLDLAIESSGQFNGVAITTGSWGETEKSFSYMQDEIAERIGFDLPTKSVLDNAWRLNDKLKSMQKVVIIIDNVEKRLDLSKIGIPQPDNNNDCRIVLVSRSLDVCKEMKTQMNLEVEPLSQEEALNLYDELAKEYSFKDTMKIKQVRDGVFSKFLWAPGEIEMLIRTSQHNQLLPPKSIVSTDGSGKKTLMLGAEALKIAHIEKPQYWRWLTPSPSTFSLKVAELIIVWWLPISVEVREEWLSPATNYGAYFVYQLTPRARGFNNTPVRINVGNITKTCYLDPLTASSKTSEGGGAMPKRRVDGWLEIELGSFFNVGHSGAVVALCVVEDNTSNIKTGLLVQGFELRPLA